MATYEESIDRGEREDRIDFEDIVPPPVHVVVRHPRACPIGFTTQIAQGTIRRLTGADGVNSLAVAVKSLNPNWVLSANPWL
jgi:hypothetical protein